MNCLLVTTSCFLESPDNYFIRGNDFFVILRALVFYEFEKKE